MHAAGYGATEGMAGLVGGGQLDAVGRGIDVRVKEQSQEVGQARPVTAPIS